MDEQLRLIEQRARESPGDLEAGWEYQRALARRGARREQFLELARLARSGDTRARATVSGWCPAIE